jgi:hypothetical protein
MNLIGKMLTGMGVLIAIYLFVANGDKTTSIISTIASNSVSGIKALQGR